MPSQLILNTPPCWVINGFNLTAITEELLNNNNISMKRISMIFHLFFFCFLLMPFGAYAYIDLGTGSYFLQFALAFIFGGIYAIKLFWKQIKSFFINLICFFRKNDR